MKRTRQEQPLTQQRRARLVSKQLVPGQITCRTAHVISLEKRLLPSTQENGLVA